MSTNEAVSDLPAGMGAPARRALAEAGITRLDQLAHLSEAEVRQLHGVGPKALGLLRQALAVRGMAFSGEAAGDQSGSTPSERET